MIQSFKENNFYRYRDEDLILSWNQNDVRLFYRLDSNNKIYTFRYDSPENLHSYFEYLGTYIQDKNVDCLAESLAHEIHAMIKKDNMEMNSLLINSALQCVKDSLFSLKGELRIPTVDPKKIICRCMRIDEAQFDLQFHHFKGVKKDLVLATNMMMTCGGCKKEFQEAFDMHTDNSRFTNGMSIGELYESLDESITKFREYTGLELEDMEIRLSDVDFPLVKLEVTPGQSIIIEEVLRRPLTNYLCAELKMIIELELTFL